MKKKLLTLMLGMIMACCLAACGGKDDSTEVSSQEPGLVDDQDTISEDIAGITEDEPESEDEDMTSEDIAELTEEEKLEAELEEMIKSAQVGDVIEFGTFEQDGDDANGEEPIEWIVLADEDGKKLLLSKYILMSIGDMMEFPGDGVNYTWKECGIRTYLNGDFYESAFSDEEREFITETELKTTWSDHVSLGAELVDVETISYESLGAVISYEVGKIVTNDKIFIPDFDEEYVKYLSVEHREWWMYGTDILAKATPASGVPNKPYRQDYYDEAKYLCDPSVNLDESLVGEEFCDYIMRNGCSIVANVHTADGSWTAETVQSTAFQVVSGECGGSFSPWTLTEIPFGTDMIGIRPMMWVSYESE